MCQHNWSFSIKETKGSGKYDYLSSFQILLLCSLCGEGKEAEESIEVNKPVSGKWTRHQNVEREKHGADILQPYDKNGQPNKNFIKVYGKTKEAYGTPIERASSLRTKR